MMKIALIKLCLTAVFFLSPIMAADALDVRAVYQFQDGKITETAYSLTEKGNIQYLKIPANTVPEGAQSVRIYHPLCKAKVGESGFYVFSNGMYGEFNKREKNMRIANPNVMSVFGVSTPRGALTVILKGMRYESRHYVDYKNGVYTIYPEYNFSGDKPYSDLEIKYRLMKADATYSDMAKVYRHYQLERGACLPIRERMKNRPELKEAAESPEIRIRQAWKPVPSPVGEQTAENEPPLTVKVTFDRFSQIIDEFKKQGIGSAEFCLVGWNIGGHDGRYPQIFPVEPALGGETKLRQAIEKARKNGYLIVCHTSDSGAYSISHLASRWDRDYLLVRKGGLVKSLRTWSGGNVYHTCPKCIYQRYTQNDHEKIKDLGFRGLHYIDVYSVVEPRTCYSADHPMTKEGFADWTLKIFESAQKKIGGLGSEGGFDYCVKNLDFGLYISFYDPSTVQDESSPDRRYNPRKKLNPIFDRHVPFWQIVYHGIVLSNPYSATVNYTIKDPVTRLKLIEFGGRPVFYYYSSFMAKGSNWMGDTDLICDTDRDLIESVRKIKEGWDEFQTMKHLQFEFMDAIPRTAGGKCPTVVSRV